MPGMRKLPTGEQEPVPEVPRDDLPSEPRQQSKELMRAYCSEVALYRTTCVCGHHHHDECSCGCTIFERDPGTAGQTNCDWMVDGMRYEPVRANTES